MRVWIQSHKGYRPASKNFFEAMCGFEELGAEIRSPKDLVGCGNWEHDVPVWCSEPVQFITEWRGFIRYGKILDARHYRGTWEKMPDPEVIRKAVQDYKTAPAGYSLDFGLTDTGKTLLIEVNDGYALGSYGLFYIDYAKLLAARWAELTGTKDEYEDF